MTQQNAFIILILGDTQTGKSTIIGRYLENKYIDTLPTIGLDKRDTQLDINNYQQKAQIYDTSGQEQYKPQIESEYKNAKAIVLVYDITNYQSYYNAQAMQKEVSRQNPNISYWVLVGNKVDQKEHRKIQVEEAKKYAHQIGARFIECSAKQPININLIFLTIQQWTQIQIQPKFIPEKTQKLLEKLTLEENQKVNSNSGTKNSFVDQHQKNKNNSFSLNNHVSQFIDESQQSFHGDGMQDYFNTLMKSIDPNLKQLANDIVIETQKKIQDELNNKSLKINKSKLLIEETSITKNKEQHQVIQNLEKKHKQLDKLRKEISQNLLLVQEQKKQLSVDKIIENNQTNKLEKELQKRLISVEKNMEQIKTEILLSKKSSIFNTNKNNFLTLDQSMILKQQISLIQNSQHIKEQNEQINKIKQERKKLQQLREYRYRSHLEQIQKIEKQELQQKLQQEQTILQQRKEKAIGKLASMDKIREEKTQIYKQQNQQVQQLIKTTTLHQKLENEFIQKQQSIELEQHKQKLKYIRDLHQPIRLNDLKNWEDNYEKRKRSLEDIRYEKLKNQNVQQYQIPYESIIYKQIKVEQENILKEKELAQQSQLLKNQAKEEFLNKIKKPSVSLSKQQEIEDNLNKAHHKVNYSEFVDIAKKVKQKGVFFDKDGKQIDRSIDEEYFKKMQEKINLQDSEDSKELGNKYLSEARKIIKKNNNHNTEEQNIQTYSNSENIKRNQKLLQLNEIKSHWHLKQRPQFQEQDLQNVIQGKQINGFSNQILIEEANKLTTIAIKKMQISEAKGNGKDSIEQIQKADDLLVNSIKAKLCIMEQTLNSNRDKQSQLQ